MTTVYPRECGATIASVDQAHRTSTTGSIPASAGQPCRYQRHRLHVGTGSIPASAGQPIKSHATLFRIPHSGLSPRVRGNHPLARANPPMTGSIPASAGQPHRRRTRRTRRRVYPRECGATIRHTVRIPSYEGLSPRVRGNRYALYTLSVRCGSIPASAGQPRPLSPPPPAAWVYPRECGATLVGPSTSSTYGGLSPRVRGNQYFIRVDTPSTGSIPASAGQPHIRRCPSRRHPVYPRECGATGQSSYGNIHA